MQKTEMNGNQFKDNEGRVWTFRITGRSLRRLNELGFKPSDVSKPEVIQEFMDSADVLDLMAAVLLEQLNEKQMTADSLFEDWDGDMLLTASWAFVEGCVLFLPSHIKAPMLVWVKKLKSAQTQLTSLLEAKAKSVNMESAVQDFVKEAWESSTLNAHSQ